jgi:hypothetical protein
MGRRGRRREAADAPRAPNSEYRDEDCGALVLRGALSARARARYARTMSGAEMPRGASREDAWQRATELLFEQLAVSWTIHGAPALSSPKELLGRYRMSSQAERGWVRSCLREHCAVHFPELEAP